MISIEKAGTNHFTIQRSIIYINVLCTKYDMICMHIILYWNIYLYILKCTDTMISKFISFKDNGLIICTTVYIWREKERATKTNHKTFKNFF